MKKLYFACAALILSLPIIFAGCTVDSGEHVLNYLKECKEFTQKSSYSSEYRINLTVNEDLSYTLSVKYGTGALNNYTAEGTKLEYLDCYDYNYTSEWLGVTQNNVSYKHVVKLPEATFESNYGEQVFYLVASSSSGKISNSYSVTLVYHKPDADIMQIATTTNQFYISKS